MSQYTMEQFIDAFMSSSNPEECAAKLGVSKHTVTRVAQQLRKKGVNLPPFKGGAGLLKKEFDVAALNKLIEAKKGS